MASMVSNVIANGLSNYISDINLSSSSVSFSIRYML